MVRIRGFWVAVVLLAMAAMPRGSMAAPAATLSRLASNPGVISLVRLEGSAQVYDVAYRYGQVTAGADGAYGPNVSAPRTAWYLEYQRAGATDVIGGILRDDPAMIEEGLQIFHFGLSREARNGSFPGSAWPFHGTALFLSEAAPSLLVLSDSVQASRFKSELAWQTTRMKHAAQFMLHWIGAPGNIDDRTKNHRWFEAAIALGAAGELAGDRSLIRDSELYAWSGIRMEWADGVMPENGGHDSGYQAMGLTSAARYLVLVAKGKLHAALYDALVKGEHWELSRVGADGSIDQAGDTRTADCQERDPSGQCKTVFYAPIYTALARWAALSGNGRYESAAMLVWQRSGYAKS